MKKVLVVDDFAAMREFLQEFLSGAGYEVVVCENGKRAVPYINQTDVLITDFNMPEMNGAELAKEAKRQKPGMPVLLMTGRPEDVPVDHLADTVIFKPFKINAVISWLQATAK